MLNGVFSVRCIDWLMDWLVTVILCSYSTDPCQRSFHDEHTFSIYSHSPFIGFPIIGPSFNISLSPPQAQTHTQAPLAPFPPFLSEVKSKLFSVVLRPGEAVADYWAHDPDWPLTLVHCMKCCERPKAAGWKGHFCLPYTGLQGVKDVETHTWLVFTSTEATHTHGQSQIKWPSSRADWMLFL